MIITRLTDSIITIDDFLTRAECLDFIVRSETNGYELATINTAGGARVRTDVRNNDRAFINNEALARAFWEKAQAAVPERIEDHVAVGLNKLFRFYRYQRGHQFKGHYDAPFVRNERERSFYTFMVYLNDNFGGGETTFRGLRVRPRQGMALLFIHDLFHEGSEVTHGVKYVLRSDVMYRLTGTK